MMAGFARRPWVGKAAYEALREDGRAAAERMLRAWLAAKPGSWVRRRVVEVMLGKGCGDCDLRHGTDNVSCGGSEQAECARAVSERV